MLGHTKLADFLVVTTLLLLFTAVLTLSLCYITAKPTAQKTSLAPLLKHVYRGVA
jgi:hypothetical protein